MEGGRKFIVASYLILIFIYFDCFEKIVEVMEK